MPVCCEVEIVPIEQERFHAIDKVVMRHAFDIHNSLGRFCDEKIYQDELATCCQGVGLATHRELRLNVSCQDFTKPYIIDLLINNGVMYELKAAEALHGSHQEQLINYLLLADLRHGKLINFRPSSVESRFVSTKLRYADRVKIRWDEKGWRSGGDRGDHLRDILSTLLAEWGAFLEANLYREAILHFLRYPGAGVCPVDIQVSGRTVGAQEMCLLDDHTAWHLSALRRNVASYETHLTRLLGHTRLNTMHWINLDQRVITLKTLRK